MLIHRYEDFVRLSDRFWLAGWTTKRRFTPQPFRLIASRRSCFSPLPAIDATLMDLVARWWQLLKTALPRFGLSSLIPRSNGSCVLETQEMCIDDQGLACVSSLSKGCKLRVQYFHNKSLRCLWNAKSEAQLCSALGGFLPWWSLGFRGKCGKIDGHWPSGQNEPPRDRRFCSCFLLP